MSSRGDITERLQTAAKIQELADQIQAQNIAAIANNTMVSPNKQSHIIHALRHLIQEHIATLHELQAVTKQLKTIIEDN